MKIRERTEQNEKEYNTLIGHRMRELFSGFVCVAWEEEKAWKAAERLYQMRTEN